MMQVDGLGGNARVCGCSSMVEQKLPKLLTTAKNSHPSSKTRQETALVNQGVSFRAQNKTGRKEAATSPQPWPTRTKEVRVDEVDIAAKGGVHKYLIDRFVSEFPEARKRGFMPALKCLPDASYMGWLFAETDWPAEARLIPDAYIIDADRRCVVIYEAVVHHDIEPGKLGRIIDLSLALDEDYWELALVRETQLCRRTYAPIMLNVVVQAHRLATGDRTSIPRDWINHHINPTPTPSPIGKEGRL